MFQDLSKSDKNKHILDEDLCLFMTISRWILLRNKHISDSGVEKIKRHILYWVIFFRKSNRLGDNAEKYCRAGQVTDDSKTRCMAFRCWITKATNTHCVFNLLLFQYNNSYVNGPQCYVMRALLHLYIDNLISQSTRWFEYDRDKLWLVYTQIVPVIFEPPCRITLTCIEGEKR